MPKMFTLREAEESLPQLEQWLRTAIEAKQEAVSAEKHLQELATRVHLLGGMELNPSDVAARRLLKDQGVERFKDAMEKIEEAGCIVKDVDIGLIDFPSLLGTEEIYLCWRLGEPRIEYWHHVHEGFAGRKLIQDPKGFGEGSGSSRPN
jgi:hypothetical protein